MDTRNNNTRGLQIGGDAAVGILRELNQISKSGSSEQLDSLLSNENQSSACCTSYSQLYSSGSRASLLHTCHHHTRHEEELSLALLSMVSIR